MESNSTSLRTILEETMEHISGAAQAHKPRLEAQEYGVVRYIGHSIARVDGLPGVEVDELVQFQGGLLGMAFNLDRDEVGVVLLDKSTSLKAGSQAHRTHRLLSIPVGDALIGRVITPTGQPLDNAGSLRVSKRLPVEREAPPIMDRAPVSEPLQTGIKSIDALIPVGRGQRELILGDRQTGKTSIALDTIINQRHEDVLCIYCAIGQRSSAVARFIADLKQHDALDYSIVVVAGANTTPGLQFIAPYAATTIGEYFMAQGQDVLIIYDDLTRHAWSYRELSLLLRRPPGREAYPGDIFYIHSRLLERSTHLNEERGGGSLTALPIAETEAQNISAYIPTNLISITDGQIYLSPELFQKGLLPAVDVSKSVSRVGGKTQLAAYRAVAGDLRLSYSQFEELERFARFETRLDDATRQAIERGQRVREILKQPIYFPVPVDEQIAALLAVSSGLFDEVPLAEINRAEAAVRKAAKAQLQEVRKRIRAGEELSEEDHEALLRVAEKVVQKKAWKEEDADA